jgi:hypothetical protein
MIDHGIFSTVLRTVRLLWHVRSCQFPAEVKATSTGKQLDSLPRSYQFLAKVKATCSGKLLDSLPRSYQTLQK